MLVCEVVVDLIFGFTIWGDPCLASVMSLLEQSIHWKTKENHNMTISQVNPSVTTAKANTTSMSVRSLCRTRSNIS